AHGTVVQLAQTTQRWSTRAALLRHVADNGPDAHPQWWREPTPHVGPVAKLRRVVLRSPALDDAVGFFRDLLYGEVEHKTDDRVELVWPGGSRVAIEHHPDAAPGVDRYEVEGLAQETMVIGARFSPPCR